MYVHHEGKKPPVTSLKFSPEAYINDRKQISSYNFSIKFLKQTGNL